MNGEGQWTWYVNLLLVNLRIVNWLLWFFYLCVKLPHSSDKFEDKGCSIIIAHQKKLRYL